MATVEATIENCERVSCQQSEDVEGSWLTIPELSRMTGKKQTALRMWLKRKLQNGQNECIKKKSDNHGDKWLVHSSLASRLRQHVEAEYVLTDHTRSTNVEAKQCHGNMTQHVDLISFETYANERKEWQQERDQIMQGLMMYRYKYEELDSRIRLLPAPVEMVSLELKQKQMRLEEMEKEHQQKERVIAQAQEIIRQVEAKLEQFDASMGQLQEKLNREKMAREELRKPWWKRIFRRQ